MPSCPVCEHYIDADDTAFAHHVNAHFDEGGVEDVGAVVAAEEVEFIGETDASSLCFVCGHDIGHLSEADRNVHVGQCLDRAPTPENDLSESDDGFYDDKLSHARKQGHQADGQWEGSAFAARQGGGDKNKGDKWWDPVHGTLAVGSVPSNFSPGVITVLADLLSKSAEQGSTRSAVLACNGVHIKGAWGFDGTWGCGYRNAMMSIAALLLVSSSSYMALFKNNEPGVRAIQGWIEDGWKSGFDTMGREQFKGKLLGTARWIGTSDLYAMFSALGVPCTLYDFRKPAERDVPNDEDTYKILQRWIKAYFDEDAPAESSGDVFDKMMHRKPVRTSSKLPLILQHAGHSRTVVGYELDSKGEIILLLFDPAKTVPRDIRDAGLEAARRERSGQPASPAKPTTVRIREDDDAASPSEDDEVRPGGWVRKRVQKVKNGPLGPLATSLSAFRFKPKKWGPVEFQVLAFDGGPVMPATARVKRKIVTSVPVDTFP